MSGTDLHLLSIARALVMNPEVLVMIKPLGHFNDWLAGRVFALLREFVDKRGVEQPADEFLSRRPRTCFFTTANTKRWTMVDRVLHVSKHKVVCTDRQKNEKLRNKINELVSSLPVD